MTDRLTPVERSRQMARIKGVNTLPELRLRKALHARGLRFRLHVRSLPGRPDVVLPRHRAIVFVHGCFWHRHNGCKLAYKPKSNALFWCKKFAANSARDKRQLRDLASLGWRVVIAWECELRSSDSAAREAARIAAWVRSGSADDGSVR
jgi:DNA mismatch endonuclease (patch repair protein)